MDLDSTPETQFVKSFYVSQQAKKVQSPKQISPHHLQKQLWYTFWSKNLSYEIVVFFFLLLALGKESFKRQKEGLAIIHHYRFYGNSGLH